MKKLGVVLCSLLAFNTFSQDTVRVMYYNLLNYPSAGIDRYDYHKVFLHYAKPDVFVVNELESAAGADLILDSALNINGTTHYQRAVFHDGYDTDNCLFYNADKLGLVSQLQLGTVLRDISVYRMYYKAPNLSAETDTIYMWFFSCHLKAGSGDFDQRNTEAQQAKFYMNDIADIIENVFVGGDFNFYSGFESGCQTLLNAGQVPLVDPVNAIGNWSGAWTYADWHTQSTRVNGIGGGSGGGLDDRFDLILVSEDVMNNSNGVTYLNGTFAPLGQDGNHFNESVNSGSNSAVPDSVADALYWSSDHLPVMMDVVMDETAGLATNTPDYFQVYFDPQEHSLKFLTAFEQFELALFDMMGKEVFRSEVVNKTAVVPESLNGVFVWSVMVQGRQLSNKVAIY